MFRKDSLSSSPVVPCRPPPCLGTIISAARLLPASCAPSSCVRCAALAWPWGPQSLHTHLMNAGSVLGPMWVPGTRETHYWAPPLRSPQPSSGAGPQAGPLEGRWLQSRVLKDDVRTAVTFLSLPDLWCPQPHINGGRNWVILKFFCHLSSKYLKW